MGNKEYFRRVGVLFRKVESKLDEFEELIDYDRTPDKIEISFEGSSKRFVVNTQRAIQEVWFAGSGRGWHFKYQEEEGTWYAHAEQEEFFQCFDLLLAQALKEVSD